MIPICTEIKVLSENAKSKHHNNFLKKSLILAPMSDSWYTDHAPAVWHSERSVTSWQAAKKAPQAAAASERKL